MYDICRWREEGRGTQKNSKGGRSESVPNVDKWKGEGVKDNQILQTSYTSITQVIFNFHEGKLYDVLGNVIETINGTAKN